MKVIRYKVIVVVALNSTTLFQGACQSVTAVFGNTHALYTVRASGLVGRTAVE
jgi:hypothetical protein